MRCEHAFEKWGPAQHGVDFTEARIRRKFQTKICRPQTQPRFPNTLLEDGGRARIPHPGAGGRGIGFRCGSGPRRLLLGNGGLRWFGGGVGLSLHEPFRAIAYAFGLKACGVCIEVFELDVFGFLNLA